MTRRRRLLLGGLALLVVGAGAVLTAGQSWARRHVRAVTAPGEPQDLGCVRCHGPKAASGEAAMALPAAARPTPGDLDLSPDGRSLYAVLAPQRRVLRLDADSLEPVLSIAPGGWPGAVAVAPDGATVAITLEDRHEVVLASTATGAILSRHATGTEPHGVVFDATGRRLFVANAGSDDVSVLDLASGAHVRRPAGHEPFTAVRSPDGTRIAVVARRASLGPPERVPSSEVTLFDGATGLVTRRVALPSCHMAESAAFTPDGATLLVPLIEVHNLVPILQVARGWVLAGVLATVEVATGEVAVLPLAEPTRGFGDPAGIAIAADGATALVLAGGNDEVALVDLPALLAARAEASPSQPRALGLARRYVVTRRPLGPNPRDLVRAGDRVFVAERLADAIAVVSPEGVVASRRVLDPTPPDLLRRGEQVFHDARTTFQGHFACRSCHPGAHTDGLTYDFEVDGIGRDVVLNRSLLGLAGTEPFKWVGSNPTLNRQCGPRFAMVLSRADPFPESDLLALVGWMHSLAPPRPRPRAGEVEGVDDGAVARGRRLFERVARKDGSSIPPAGRCVTCHPLPHGTTGKKADVGTQGPHDKTGLFDIAHLTGVATKAPYLHDARATTLEEIWTLPGVGDRHGVVTDLSKADLNDLIEFLRGL